jgi:hypothetical protein
VCFTPDFARFILLSTCLHHQIAQGPALFGVIT